MVLIEEFANIIEIRSGRQIFVRKVLISSTDSTSSSTPSQRLKTSQQQNQQIQLLFVHGLCGTEQQFQLLLQSMDKIMNAQSEDMDRGSDHIYTISCILYDNIGCGQSPTISDWDAYSNDELQHDLMRLCTYQDIEQTNNLPLISSTIPIIIIGHSYAPSIFLPILSSPTKNTNGDNITILPNLIGMIFINTAVRGENIQSFTIPDGGHVIMRLPVMILQCIQSILTEGFIKVAVHPDHRTLQDAIREHSQHNNMFVAQSYHRHTRWADIVHLHQTRKRNRTRHIPILLIHGTNDLLIPIECAQSIHNEILSNDTAPSDMTTTSDLVVIDKASHMTMLEQPDQTARAILKFINDHVK